MAQVSVGKGFDDIEDGRYSCPSLTTISSDKWPIAARALGYLAERLDDDRANRRGTSSYRTAWSSDRAAAAHRAADGRRPVRRRPSLAEPVGSRHVHDPGQRLLGPPSLLDGPLCVALDQRGIGGEIGELQTSRLETDHGAGAGARLELLDEVLHAALTPGARAPRGKAWPERPVTAMIARLPAVAGTPRRRSIARCMPEKPWHARGVRCRWVDCAWG
jgi:hypothetical protein